MLLCYSGPRNPMGIRTISSKRIGLRAKHPHPSSKKYDPHPTCARRSKQQSSGWESISTCCLLNLQLDIVRDDAIFVREYLIASSENSALSVTASSVQPMDTLAACVITVCSKNSASICRCLCLSVFLRYTHLYYFMQ